MISSPEQVCRTMSDGTDRQRISLLRLRTVSEQANVNRTDPNEVKGTSKNSNMFQ
jgi:hypothetical protein